MQRLHLLSWVSLWSTTHKTTASTCIFPQLTTLSFSRCMGWRMPSHQRQPATSLVRQMIPAILSISFGSCKTQALQNSGGQTPLGDPGQTRHKLCCQRTQPKLTKKRVVEQASTIEIQAFADSDWAGCAKTRKSTSGASLALWGVTLANSSRTQATQALSSAEADLYAMGMAIQDALHLQSLLQEMKLTQLAKPFELTVYTDSSSGKALASKLGLSRKSSMWRKPQSNRARYFGLNFLDLVLCL